MSSRPVYPTDRLNGRGSSGPVPQCKIGVKDVYKCYGIGTIPRPGKALLFLCYGIGKK